MTDYPYQSELQRRYFRRDYFPMAPNRQPLWHILVSADKGHLTALCGYTYYFVLEDALLRRQVKTKKLRCAKCDAKVVKA
jgi:hypothetical protein